jgi:hypothetical protein
MTNVRLLQLAPYSGSMFHEKLLKRKYMKYMPEKALR